MDLVGTVKVAVTLLNKPLFIFVTSIVFHSAAYLNCMNEGRREILCSLKKVCEAVRSEVKGVRCFQRQQITVKVRV